MTPYLFFHLTFFHICSAKSQPNIVVIVADDLGYNDVSWHNPDILSPNLARLAKEGLVLEQSYVQPICTPTRSALMSGRYPIHTGRQHSVLWPEEPRGLHTSITLLPRLLQQQGYATHMVGKWHLGFCCQEMLPTSRGFDTFYGYYTGSEHYFNHTRMPSTLPAKLGYDLRDQDSVAWEARGKYSAHLFAARAEALIRQQENSVKPLFLYLAFQSVHSPLQVPDEYEQPFLHINNTARRTFSGMVMAMDEAVGNLTKALDDAGLADNTLILFTADNGGQTKNGGNNFPLRGNKATLWEGGTRAAAFVHGKMLAGAGGDLRELIHVTDWLPTLYRAAGGDPSKLGGLDGFDQWDTLTKGKASARVEMLYNIDPLPDMSNGPGGAIRVGPFKLIRGDPGRPDGWIHPDLVVNEVEGVPVEYQQAEVQGNHSSDQVLLFHLDEDPYEKKNLASEFPAITQYLGRLLNQYQAGMVAPDIAPRLDEGNPFNFRGVWSPGWCNASTYSTVP